MDTAMRIVELDRVSEPYWEELIAGESEPFGGIGEQLSWRDKSRNLGVRDEDGSLVAAGGVVLAEVRPAEGAPFQVAGVGGLIVTQRARGKGVARSLVLPLLEIAGELPVERAMLFCVDRLMPFYAEFDFREVPGPVWADQPGGRIEMPLGSMWKPLCDGVDWPPGRIDLVGEPF
jgi:predicted GNAT family N-acyltransferase